MNYKIKKVLVEIPFPFYEHGDVLKLNEETGMFEYAFNETKRPMDVEVEKHSLDVVNKTSSAISDKQKPNIPKKEVVKNLGYFTDLTGYEPKNTKDIEERISTYRDYVSYLKNKNTDLMNKQDRIEVDYNIELNSRLIEDLEWVLGLR